MNDPLSEVIHVGYALCLNALRVQRDIDKLHRIVPYDAGEDAKAIFERYSKVIESPSSAAIDLQSHAFRLRMEALDAVEGGSDA